MNRIYKGEMDLLDAMPSNQDCKKTARNHQVCYEIKLVLAPACSLDRVTAIASPVAPKNPSDSESKCLGFRVDDPSDYPIQSMNNTTHYRN